MAAPSDAQRISAICSAGWRVTYRNLIGPACVEDVIACYYSVSRIADEIRIAEQSTAWLGWVVCDDEGGDVVAAGGGGLSDGHAEVYVLYVMPGALGRGFGTLVLDAITNQHIALGALEQWVSVTKGNDLGIPFYLARGFEIRDDVPRLKRSGAVEGVGNLRLSRRIGEPITRACA